MLISEQKRFVFVHVQKTAGTSLSDVLSPYALNPSASRWNKIASDAGLVTDWHRFHFRKHASLRKVESVLPREIYTSYFKFAFVRNPWERLLSWYQYVQNTPGHADRKNGETFADFAMRFIGKPRRAQWWMLEDSHGAMGLDFVGRFEQLDDDIGRLCKILDIPFNALPHHNKMSKKDYRLHYDQRLADVVHAAWQTEIDFFGYRFEA